MSHHSCSTVVITCIDFRFQKPTHEWLVSQNLLGDHDRVGIAGGVLNLTAPLHDEHRVLLIQQIKIAHTLHHIQKVILINHEDCGAYGGTAAFESSKQEQAKHEEELTKAAEMIKHDFPELEVEIYFAKLDGAVERVE